MEPARTRPPDRIRLATPDDAESARSLYAPYVDTPVTFEEEVPAPAVFRERVQNILAAYPFLVAEQDGHVVGFAYAHRQAERAAYGWNAELSVYLAPHACGSGAGSILYRALIELVRLQGVKAAYALVTVPNAASEHLHERFGFKLMGVQQNAGYTCGAWHDVAWYVKPLAAFDDNPSPIVPFPAVVREQPESVQAVLDRANAELADGKRA